MSACLNLVDDVSHVVSDSKEHETSYGVCECPWFLSALHALSSSTYAAHYSVHD